jgi:hypothetical protein
MDDARQPADLDWNPTSPPHIRGVPPKVTLDEFCPFLEPGSNWTTSQSL